jgi:hypothetical protein
MGQTFLQASANMPEVVASLHALFWLQNKPKSQRLSRLYLLSKKIFLGLALSRKHEH